MGIEVKFSELESVDEEDRKKIFKMIFDQAAENKYQTGEVEPIDFDREPGDDIDELVEEARKHCRKMNKDK